MPTNEIANPTWQSFFNEFSRLHVGEPAELQVVGQDLGAQEEASGLPFSGISYEEKGSARGSIIITLGTDPSARIEHMVEHPTRVWARTEGDADHDAIEIEGDDGVRTILQLKSIAALPG